MRCHELGCSEATTHGKSWCADHLSRHAYVANLTARIKARKAEHELVAKQGREGVNVHGDTARDILVAVAKAEGRIKSVAGLRRFVETMDSEVFLTYVEALSEANMLVVTEGGPRLGGMASPELFELQAGTLGVEHEVRPFELPLMSPSLQGPAPAAEVDTEEGDLDEMVDPLQPGILLGPPRLPGDPVVGDVVVRIGAKGRRFARHVLAIEARSPWRRSLVTWRDSHGNVTTTTAASWEAWARGRLGYRSSDVPKMNYAPAEFIKKALGPGLAEKYRSENYQNAPAADWLCTQCGLVEPAYREGQPECGGCGARPGSLLAESTEEDLEMPESELPLAITLESPEEESVNRESPVDPMVIEQIREQIDELSDKCSAIKGVSVERDQAVLKWGLRAQIDALLWVSKLLRGKIDEPPRLPNGLSDALQKRVVDDLDEAWIRVGPAGHGDQLLVSAGYSVTPAQLPKVLAHVAMGTMVCISVDPIGVEFGEHVSRPGSEG